jgi:hypothetical protein
MPLRDHFRPPLSEVWPWHTLHGNWATKMVDRLNGEMLDDRFMSQSGRHFGAQVEVDVGTLERDDRGSLFSATNGDGGGVATEPTVFAAPVPLSAVVGFDDPDLFEVKVYRGGGGWNLVAAVELVSESNKDRPESRRALAVKVGSYLQQGVSVVVVDTVTNHAANPHAELADVLRLPPALRWESPTGLSVVAYRAVRRAPPAGPAARLDVWPYPLAVGDPLPTVPLWLAPDLSVPLELELTYAAACRSLRIR